MHAWLCCLCVFILAESARSDEFLTNRPVRMLQNFPYSVNLYRMLGHDRELRPYYGVDDEVAQIIDNLNMQPELPRLRRSGMSGYACRFKFCRIFDS